MAKELLTSVTHPTEGGNSDGFENKLCRCEGVAEKQASNFLFNMVRVWGTNPTTGLPNLPGAQDADDTFDQNDGRLIPDGSGGYSWLSSNIPCKLPNGNDPLVENQVRAIAYWYDDVTFEPLDVPPLSVLTPVSYKANRVAMCGEARSQAALAHRAVDFVDRPSSGRRRGFVRYSDVPAIDSFIPTYGSRLLYRGSPLRASKIQISAFGVQYSYGSRLNPLTVSRPAGPTLSPPSESTRGHFNFPGLPEWSIIVQQKDSGLRHVIASDNIKLPETLYLSPDKDVFVKINIDLRMGPSIQGGFGLYVDLVE